MTTTAQDPHGANRHAPQQPASPAWPRRLLERPLVRQIASFAIVGGLATLAFFVVYNGMRLVASPFVSNAVAIVSSSFLNFTMNRRFTFGWAGWRRWLRQLLEFSAVLAVTLGASSAGLAALFRMHPNPGIVEENVAVIVASGLLFVVRFWLLRIWVFDHRRQ
jgi:putative flippase GtrA